MAKAGTRRPDPREPHGTESNHKARCPAKRGKAKVRPIIGDGSPHPQKVYHQLKGDGSVGSTRPPAD